MNNCQVIECVTERSHNLGLGVADRTSTNAKRSSLYHLFWWLSRERTWTRRRGKKYLDESWVLIVNNIFARFLYVSFTSKQV